MRGRDYHVHCILCEKSYPSRKKAEQCFKNHNEIEHLKWVAAQVCYMKSYMYDLMKHIDFIDEKYGVQDYFFDLDIFDREEQQKLLYSWNNGIKYKASKVKSWLPIKKENK